MQKEVYEFISKKTNDPIVERRICRVSGEEFAIFQSDKDFFQKLGPIINGENISFPLPIYCPRERAKRRMSFRNERNLYHRKCDSTQKNLVTIYKPQTKVTVYDRDVWWGDQRDACDYAQDINWNESFSKQYFDLFSVVPTPNMLNSASENSNYCNHVGYMKNCYMVHASWGAEKCLYGNKTRNSFSCVDCLEVAESKRCYECSGCESCFKLRYSIQSKSCRDSRFLYGCENCEDCIGCVNLVGKRRCIFNEQYSEEEYKEKQQSYISSRENLEQTKSSRKELLTKQFRSDSMLINCEGSYGNKLKNCSSCIGCFSLVDGLSCKWCENGVDKMKDMQDGYGIGINSELGYQIVDTGHDTRRTSFCITCHGCQDIWYCHNCHNSSFLFGCIGLKHKKYCIFNKQYSKEEWEKLVEKLISHMEQYGEWGVFFNPSYSPFGYNETIANEYYPLSPDVAGSSGFAWSTYEYNIDIPTDTKIINAEELPFSIEESDTSILEKVVLCTDSQKPYRFTKQEVSIYNSLGVPLPQQHHDIRYIERIKESGGRELYLRKCDKTGEEILCVYSSNVPFKVYSQEAYRKEVY